MKGYIYLLVAIAGELLGTVSLKAAEGFSKIIPSILVIGGYGVAFYFLSLTLKYLPLGMTYAMWAGLGTALTAVIGVLFWKETIHLPQIIGLIFIIAGVIMLNLFKSASA
ncbi:DMT family transporter [Paenactinomyces guangxiensis]|uniref:Multidrug efflux SMR transporter n=1 Tax=Paenactinomyces guangxiensis TaxID=1490290 RepID=A0A7W1WT29_9BACL|nr:multidrug efflux SMR transporter [Paenactinomyces guangxiensis]MBA4495563.1 multidrug efflux SMR transporter [Paenactinomyces guangxiensis]MBH8592821.1 multidrug efflux SMR transporter [Paenactinomyces guangxiensis]